MTIGSLIRGESHTDNLDAFVLRLKEIEAVKFGKFTLKSGQTSAVYVDLRGTISDPNLLFSLASHIAGAITKANVSFDHVIGVPYAALPIATHVSYILKKSLLIKRKEQKTHGTKKAIEGHFNVNDSCVIIEDVVTTGGSIIEVVQTLRSEGLKITHAFVCIDREQGAVEKLKELGIQLIPLLNVTSVLTLLSSQDSTYQTYLTEWMEYLRSPPQPSCLSTTTTTAVLPPLTQRHPIVNCLQSIIKVKRSNLCLAVDVHCAADLLEWADKCGPFICMLKTHVDIVPDFTADIAQQLVLLAKKHNFLLFEDRKLADIGNVVCDQMKANAWCDIVTAHAIPGPSVLQGIEAVKATTGTAASASGHLGVLIVAQMSSQNSYRSDSYEEYCASLATAYPHLVVGFIAQNRFIDTDDLLFCTPGVKQVHGSQDSLGQQYRSVEQAIIDDKCDIVIVGRGVTHSTGDWSSVLLDYQTAAFKALQERVLSQTH